MKIKTFPLQFTEEKLNEIRKAAEKTGKPIYQFILDCIEEKTKQSTDKDKLWEIVVAFALKHNIQCEETISQSDKVIIDGYNFIENCWNTVQTDKRIKELIHQCDNEED